MADFAIVSTYDQKIHTVSAATWAGALAEHLRGEDITWTSFLTTRESDPFLLWTADVYGPDTDHSVVVMRLEDLDVDDPHTLPVP